MQRVALGDLFDECPHLILTIRRVVLLVLVFARVAPDAGALARHDGCFALLLAQSLRSPPLVFARLLANGFDRRALAFALPLVHPVHQARGRRRRRRRLDLHHKRRRRRRRQREIQRCGGSRDSDVLGGGRHEEQREEELHCACTRSGGGGNLWVPSYMRCTRLGMCDA